MTFRPSSGICLAESYVTLSSIVTSFTVMTGDVERDRATA